MRYIKKIILQNFQSHKYTIIELDHQLNVIVGPSDSGKSAIIRGLKWVLYNEPAGDYFIREGEREASVTIEFSDNIKVKRYRSKSKNSYHLFIPDEEELIFEGFGTNVPQEIIDAINIKKIHLDSSESASINLGEQLDGAFLLSERTAIRASAIGRLVGVNVIDDALQEGLRDNRNISTIRKNLELSISKLETELEQYDYITEVSNRIQKVEIIRSIIQELTNKYNRLTELNNILIRTESSLKQSKSYLNKLKEIDNIDFIIVRLEDLYKEHKYYNNKKRTYHTVKTNINEEIHIIKKLENLHYGADKCDLLSKLLIRMNALNKLNNSISKYKYELETCNKTIDKLKHISNLQNTSKLIHKKSQELLNLKQLNISYTSIQNNINKGQIYMENFTEIDQLDIIINNLNFSNNKILKLQNIYNKLKILTSEINKTQESVIQNNLLQTKHLKDYRDLLSKQEVCPVCLSYIDENKVNHIIEHYK